MERREKEIECLEQRASGYDNYLRLFSQFVGEFGI
jgi:hypothetical protein